MSERYYSSAYFYNWHYNESENSHQIRSKMVNEIFGYEPLWTNPKAYRSWNIEEPETDDDDNNVHEPRGVKGDKGNFVKGAKGDAADKGEKGAKGQKGLVGNGDKGIYKENSEKRALPEADQEVQRMVDRCVLLADEWAYRIRNAESCGGLRIEAPVPDASEASNKVVEVPDASEASNKVVEVPAGDSEEREDGDCRVCEERVAECILSTWHRICRNCARDWFAAKNTCPWTGAAVEWCHLTYS